MKKFFKNIRQHMPAITAGICCWIFIWYVSGTSCWIRSLFGIPCPGCGSTRAAAALFHGHIKKAVYFHPLIFITFALIAFCIIVFVFKITPNKPATVILWGILGLYAVVYIARMILFFPKIEPMTYLDTSILGRIIGFVKNILF